MGLTNEKFWANDLLGRWKMPIEILTLGLALLSRGQGPELYNQEERASVAAHWTAPGRYTVTASKGSYVGLGYGQQRPTDLTKPIVILDNQLVEKMDLMLPRGSVIAGRILDEFGEPVSDVQVAAQQYQTIQGQRGAVAIDVVG